MIVGVESKPPYKPIRKPSLTAVTKNEQLVVARRYKF
jgi:hypothetical protein